MNKDQWFSKVVAYEVLEETLNAEVAKGHDIATIVPVNNTHACVVSVKPAKSELEQKILKRGKK